MVRQGTSSSEKSTLDSLGEGEGFLENSDREHTSPPIVPVYNGKTLDISSEFMNQSLSGISLKHYDGSCSRPKSVSSSEVTLLGEDYLFDYGESISDEDEEFWRELSQTSSSGMRLCYVPRRHDRDLGGEDVPEGEMESEDSKPLCVLDKIRDRNSFWDLHRPELCKLTWPQVYVGEAIIIEHLHKHLLHHGYICSSFHERQDMLALLNKELDSYDKLKEIHPPRELPPDDKPFNAFGNQKPFKARICNKFTYNALRTVNWSDESDIDICQSLHTSKEEFCITIGKPLQRPKLRVLPVPEPEQLWLPGEGGTYDYGEYRDFMYPECWEEARYTVCGGEAENSIGEETPESDSVPQEPTGWVEPDYCAMI